MSDRKTYLGVFGTRLFLTMAALSVILVGAVGYWGYWNARSTIIRSAADNMQGVAEDRAAQLHNWFEERRQEINFLANLPEVVELTKRMSISGKSRRDSLRLDSVLKAHREIYNYYGAGGFFDMQGKPLALLNFCSFAAAEIIRHPEFVGALNSDEPVFGKFFRMHDGQAGINLSCAITDEDGKKIGVLTLLLLPEHTLNSLLANYANLGATGETYIAGEDSTMLTPSRNPRHPKEMTHKMTTKGVVECLQGKNYRGIYTNYTGEKVIGAGVWLAEQKWALMAEMTVREAYAPLKMAAVGFVIVLGLGLAMVFAASIVISKKLTQPLYELAQVSESITEGNLDVSIAISGKDEVGHLAARFHEMVKALKSSRGQLEKSHREMLQTEKLAAIGRLVASVVHEMRNPLSAVKMNIRIIEKKGGLTDIGNTHLEIASKQTLRLEKMLNELLEFSKPVTPQISPFDLTELVNRTIADHSDLFTSKQIRLNCAIPSYKLKIESDPDLLTRIIDNLLTNAVNASENKGVISVVILDAEMISIIISDRGKGMSKKALERLFEPFFTTRENGVGLGMSNVKKFVELLGGSIEIQSAEGEGTIATLKFNPKGIYAENTDNR